MRKRPLALLLFSICMMTIALSLPLQVVYLQDVESLFQMLTWLNIFIMALCVATAVAVFKLHKSFHYLLPITIAAVIFNNWWVGYVGFNYNLTETSIASLSFLILCSVLLEKKAIKVLRSPKLKWWDVPLRSKIEIPVSLSPSLRGQVLIKKSFDISESGFFLQGLEKSEFDSLNVGEKFGVCLHFSKILKIRCEAKIVRKSAQNGSYPSGIGLQFEKIDAQIKSTIKQLSQSHHHEVVL
ncbi:MAG: PilZ domain-containing protein [Bdellovibrionota bacterium]